MSAADITTIGALFLGAILIPVISIVVAVLVFVKGGLAVIRIADASWVAWDRFVAWTRKPYPIPLAHTAFVLVTAWFAIAIPTLAISWYVYLDPTDLPDAQEILNYQPPQIGTITDRNGVSVMRAYTEARTVLPTDRFMDPKYRNIRNAVVAAEDGDFWSHDGWNPRRTLIAGAKTALKTFGFRKQGASTIEQQDSRNIYPALRDMVARQKRSQLVVSNPVSWLLSGIKGPVYANTFMRKWREIKWSVHGENQLILILGSKQKAKEHLLAAYANMIYMGHGTYGFVEGARFYYSKDLSELDIAEAAFLASLIPAPDLYGHTEPDAAEMVGRKSRRDEVLRRMYDNGFITRKQFNVERTKPIVLSIHRATVKTEAPAAIDMMNGELTRLGFTQRQLIHGDIQVQLTIDMEAQRLLTTAVRQGVYGDPAAGVKGFAGQYPQESTPQSCGVVLDNGTGRVLAIFGGFIPDNLWYSYDTFNRCIDAVRQPGSGFKMVDVMAAIAAGFTPDSPMSDAPISVRMGNGSYKVIGNFDEHKNIGTAPMREMLARSINTAFMRLMRDQVGQTATAAADGAVLRKQYGRFIDPGAATAVRWAHQLGIVTELQPNLATVLGGSGVHPIEMANVLRTLLSGQEASPHIIARITDRNGRVLYPTSELPEPSVRPLRYPGTDTPVPQEKLDMVRELLRGNVRLPEGTGRSLNTSDFPIQVYAKTGTSNDHHDTWGNGGTNGQKGVAMSVWVGYDDFAKAMPGKGLPIAQQATGGRIALPIVKLFFRSVYGKGKPFGEPPPVPDNITRNLDVYICAHYPNLCGAK